MSFTLKNIYAASPATTRGKALLLGGDPKGKNFLYTSANQVVIRGLEDPLQVDLYSEHQHAPTVARYAPSGFYIASGDSTGTIRIWDTTQKEHILKIELRVLAGAILDLQWSDDSKRIVAVGEGKEKFGSVFLFDSGSSVGEITGHTKTISSCDFKQTRPYRVATGSEDFQVAWLEGPPFKFKKHFTEHTRFVNCVRFSPDGNRLLTVSSDKTAFLYDGKTGDLVGPLAAEQQHTAAIYAASWAPDSKRFVTASADKTVKMWDAETRACLKTFTISANPQVEDMQVGVLWQGETIISVSLSGDINYLDQNDTSKPRKIVRGHNKFITSLAYDASTNRLYTGAYDAAIVRWDLETNNSELLKGKGHTNQVNQMFVQGNELFTASMDDTLRTTSLANETYSDASTKLEHCPTSLAVGKGFTVAITSDGIVLVKGGKVVTTHALKYQGNAIALSPDQGQVAIGGKDNGVHLYSLSGDKFTDGSVLTGHNGFITSLAYSPDGKYLVSGDNNRELLVWNPKTGSKDVSGWVYHTARVSSVSWSPDSKHVASGSLDGSVYVWDVENPTKRIQIRDAHRAGVNCVLWINNNTLASAGQDCNAKTWALTF
eukprot:TRINITY_DN883_c0_g1_i1.p1 TRINITY_DN883_c0_g1~~TRINITY_DN883_c0_g1_i1.p1  ORF type:complete len:602 (-),score=207.47 TRINITY_DN883_c0_g1_i1:174-1979(-)